MCPPPSPLHRAIRRSGRSKKSPDPLNTGAPQAVFLPMNARPRLHLLLASVLLWAAIPLLKVCCFNVADKSPTCCALTQKAPHHDSPPSPPENHASPCCSGSSYLAKEDTSVPAHPSSTPTDHLAPPHEFPNPLFASSPHPVHHLAQAPSPQPLRRELSVTLHTCCAPNAPPRALT
jgi:hypothetical protein